MKTILILIALCISAFAELNDPVEFRGTVMGIVVDKRADGGIVIAATQIRSKQIPLSPGYYVVIRGIPAGVKSFLDEPFKCTGVMQRETVELSPGTRPVPVFKYVAP